MPEMHRVAMIALFTFLLLDQQLGLAHPVTAINADRSPDMNEQKQQTNKSSRKGSPESLNHGDREGAYT